MVALSIIVPIYNEETELRPMAIGLARHLDDIVGIGQWQFILVDNGSTDQSPEVIERLKETWPNTISIRLPKPDYGDSLLHGLNAAVAPWAYIINVDWWDDVMLRWCWRHRGLYDLVLGSKRADPQLNRQHKYRKFLTWGLNTILQSVFGFVGTDTHGQKFLSLASMRPIIAQCKIRRGQFDTELTLRAMRKGLWLAEVPVPCVETRPPRNLMVTKICRNVVDIVRLKRLVSEFPIDRPIRYHRWAREDLDRGETVQARVFLAAAEGSRGLAPAEQAA